MVTTRSMAASRMACLVASFRRAGFGAGRSFAGPVVSASRWLFMANVAADETQRTVLPYPTGGVCYETCRLVSSEPPGSKERHAIVLASPGGGGSRRLAAARSRPVRPCTAGPDSPGEQRRDAAPDWPDRRALVRPGCASPTRACGLDGEPLDEPRRSSQRGGLPGGRPPRRATTEAVTGHRPPWEPAVDEPAAPPRGDDMLIRRETDADAAAIDIVHRAAFDPPAPGVEPVEVGLVRALRADEGWLPELSLVAEHEGEVVGHVVCTLGSVGRWAALGLGPIGVLPDSTGRRVRRRVDARGPRRGGRPRAPGGRAARSSRLLPALRLRPAGSIDIAPTEPAWVSHFQARTLSAWRPEMIGTFHYAAPFDSL